MAYNPLNANGQATMANSTPVVIASNQSAVQTGATLYENGTTVLNEQALPNGSLYVSQDPTPLFDDTFQTTLDTTARWNTPVSAGGGVAAVSSGGALTLGTGTTANGYSYLLSQYAFPPLAPGYLEIQNSINLEYPITANTYRFWGFANPATTPTAAAPITDGMGFEVATSGKMYAISYSNGTRNVIQDLSTSGNSTQPTDSNVHKYFLYMRGDKAYWTIDGSIVATMSTGAPGPINNTLQIALMAIAGSTAPASSGVLTDNGVWVGDTTKSSHQISDGTFPWRKATVSSTGALSVSSSGSVVQSNTTTIATPTSNSMAALNATVLYQVQGGSTYYLTLTNGPGATTAWVGTVTFQYSTSLGSTYSSLSVNPVASPANSAATSTATANGLFAVQVPASFGSNPVYIKATMTSYTSGTAYFFATPNAPGQKLLMPWTYTVTTANTLLGPIEASNITELDVQISAITTTQYTAQGTNDPTLTTWVSLPAQDLNNAASAGQQAIATASTFRIQPNGSKWIRIQCTTTGTVATVQGIAATLGTTQNFTSYGGSTYVSAIGTLPTLAAVTTVSTVSSVTAVAAINSVATTNGLSIGTVVTAATPATNSIKATAGRLMHISVGNPNAAAVYLKIFNVAAPTLGTTAANMNYLIPATSQTTIPINDVGLFFSTAIVIAVTGGISLTDNTSITSGCAVSYSWI